MGNLTSKRNSNNYSLEKEKEESDEREHLSHIITKEIFKMNFSSHINSILSDPSTKVLDVGCGSGFWLMDMASDYPSPNYFGIDISPVFPKSTYPSNIKFLQHDLLQGLPYEDDTFDFIHLQYLTIDFTETQWENIIYKELSRVLKPGGWLETCDAEFGILRSGPMTKKIETTALNSLLSRNINPYIFLRYHSLIETIPSLSSSTVHQERRKYPLTSGSKLGNLCVLNMKSRYKMILEGPIGQSMNIKKKDIDLIIEKITNEFESNDSYLYIHRFSVQKENSYIKGNNV